MPTLTHDSNNHQDDDSSDSEDDENTRPQYGQISRPSSKGETFFFDFFLILRKGEVYLWII